MATRKSMTLPVILTIIIISIMVFLFVNFKQSEIVCEKSITYDSDVKLIEDIIVTLDGKSIINLNVTKKIILPEMYNYNDKVDEIEYYLDKTLNYLGSRVSYTRTDYGLMVNIRIDDNNLVLLDNIEFFDNGDLNIDIDSNIKSSNVVVLSVGDNYTDGELMKRLKNNGYSCK